MPPTHATQHRLDGFIGGNPDNLPPGAAQEIVRRLPPLDEGDSIEAIKARMLARHFAAGLDVGDD
jgi:hypothetical protein